MVGFLLVTLERRNTARGRQEKGGNLIPYGCESVSEPLHCSSYPNPSVLERDNIVQARSTPCRCPDRCLHSFAEEDIYGVRAQLADMKPQAVQDFMWAHFYVSAAESQNRHQAFTVRGHNVCLAAFCTITGTHPKQGMALYHSHLSLF